MKPRAFDAAGLLLAFVSVAAVAFVSVCIFERLPHIEDEFAYLWEAEVMADGQISLPSPPYPKAFFVPFVVDHDGQRFAKYPPGWPAMLSLGARLHAPWLVNPVLAGLAVWLVYRLGAKIGGRAVGLLSALLTSSSPMFLMLGGSYLSHMLGITLAAAFSLAWLDLFPRARRIHEPYTPTWLLVSVAGGAIGVLALTRPLTAVGVALPFLVHALVLVRRGGRRTGLKMLMIAAVALLTTTLLLIWQWVLGGDPTRNLYTLWWTYDRVGFGPGVGVTQSGHNLDWAYINTRFSLRAGQHDLFGWPYLSWIFLPLGLFGLRRNRDSWLIFATAPGLILVYAAYWIGSWLYGPRYYVEALPGLAIVSAAGVVWAGGWLGERARARRVRMWSAIAVLSALLAANIFLYLPIRVGGMRGLYGIERSDLQALETAELEGALILVHAERWMEYGALLTLAPPYSERDVMFVWADMMAEEAPLTEALPERSLYYYDVASPGRLYHSSW